MEPDGGDTGLALRSSPGSTPGIPGAVAGSRVDSVCSSSAANSPSREFALSGFLLAGAERRPL